MYVMDLAIRTASIDTAQWFVAALRESGQCAGPWPAFILVGEQVFCRLCVPAEDALDPQYDSTRVARLRKDLIRVVATLVGPAYESVDPCRCGQRTHLVLYTTFISEETPLRCGQCWGLVPLYEVPSATGDGGHPDLLEWASSYRYLDGLYMASGVGEAFAYQELTRSKSDFGVRSLSLCADIERRTGIPIYAYLNRQHGERLEACPECGRAWTIEEPAGPWAFRCESCRVVLPDPPGGDPP